MLEPITDLPDNVVGIRATGKITKKEYDDVMVPAIDNMAKHTKHLSLLLAIKTDISHITAGARMDDIMMGFKHFTKWHRVAVVNNQSGVQHFINLFSRFMPGTYRGFPIAEPNAVRLWVATEEPDRS